MNLTVEQLMAQVIKFLETDQPTMAVLYMEKALEILRRERAAVQVKNAWDALREGMAPIVEFFQELAEHVVSVVREVYELTKADLALAADA